ncbi:MAG: hypothetical protein WA799_07925 [Nitrosotalea sp.]
MSTRLDEGVWTALIRDLIAAIDSRNYSLTAQEVKRQIDTDPDRLFEFLRRRVNRGTGWLTSLTRDQENQVARLLGTGDYYGEAVQKLGLTDGLTPIVQCIALFWAGYRG